MPNAHPGRLNSPPALTWCSGLTWLTTDALSTQALVFCWKRVKSHALDDRAAS